MQVFLIYISPIILGSYSRLCISLGIWCLCALAPLVPIIINSIEPVYVIYLRFVCVCVFCSTSYHDRVITSSLLSQKYSISVCPKNDAQNMNLFLPFSISPTRFFIRLSLCFFCFLSTSLNQCASCT